MEIFDLKNRPEYIMEVVELEHNEWSSNKTLNYKERIEEKVREYYKNVNDHYFCKLILIDDNKLIGFISIFPYDCDEEPDLTPWYATMYVKKEYRGKGYSRILNNAILEEAKNRNIKELYLKTDLNNYYEKFGAIPLKQINEREKLLKFIIK